MLGKKGCALLLAVSLGCRTVGARDDAGTMPDTAPADASVDAVVPTCAPAMFPSDLASLSIGYRVEPPLRSSAGDCWTKSFDAMVEFGIDGGRLRRSLCLDQTIEGYDGPISEEAVAAIRANLSQYCVIQNASPCTRSDGTYFVLNITTRDSSAAYLIGTTGECSHFPAVRDAKGPAGALVEYLKTLGATSVLADAGPLDTDP